MSFKVWIIKETVIYSYHRILLSIKKEQTFDTLQTKMNLQRIMMSEKNPISQGYNLYDSIYRTFLKLENYRNGKQTSGCQRLRRRWGQHGSWCGYNRATRAIFMGMELFCILTVSMSISWLWCVLQFYKMGKTG